MPNLVIPIRLKLTSSAGIHNFFIVFVVSNILALFECTFKLQMQLLLFDR